MKIEREGLAQAVFPRFYSFAYSVYFAVLIASSKMKCLILILSLFLAGFKGVAEPIANQFENPAVRENPTQAAWLRQKAKESQEQHRQRLSIPRAALESFSPAEAGSAGKVVQEPAQSLLSESVNVQGRGLLFGALLCLVGILTLLKVSPQTAEKIGLPVREWLTCAPGQGDLSVKVSDDDKAFAEFIVAFKAGPAGKAQKKVDSYRERCGEIAGSNSKSPIEAATDPEKPLFVVLQEQLLATRTLFTSIGRQAGKLEQQLMLNRLRAHLGALKQTASLPELLSVWQVTSAIEGLVAQLTGRASYVTPNALRTIANGLDLLIDLCQPGIKKDLSTEPPIRILAVDDDDICRHAVASALRKAFKQPDLAANSEAALAQVSMIAYDVIFLDVLMPGMDGFELCRSVRQSSFNELTPIVFVTSQSDLEARANSNLSGGTDLIAKPFLSFEITVKALVLSLRGRLEKRKTPVGSPPAHASLKTADSTHGISISPKGSVGVME